MHDDTAALCAEQRQRWLRGERTFVETYLERRPDLRQQPDAVLDLVYNEVVLREATGDAPTLNGYVQRFPEFAAELRLQFHVHRAIEDASASADGPTLGESADECVEAVKPIVAGYEILDEIGRGGMGVVYRARQLSLNRLVALKMILAGVHAGAQEVARFRIEAEAVARVPHGNVVQIHEIGMQNGLPYLSLELVDGPSLDVVCAGQALPARHAAAMVETLARAMHDVHGQGIVHRDLKPANVLLAGGRWPMVGDGARMSANREPWPANAVPKITDFGVAKLLNGAAAHTPTRAPIGTPNYMAPEQAMGQGTPVGPLADIYALGAILYELLTGQPPFRGNSLLEVLQRVRSEDPVRPSAWVPNVPADLETICLKCLHKQPRQRYGSALELAEDLRRFLAHEPIRARRTRLGERVLKWTRRRPALAGLLAAIAVGLAVVVLLNIRHGMLLHATQERARADEREDQLERLQRARAAYQSFAQHRGDAMFHWTCASLFADDDAPANLEATRQAAQQAFAVVELDDGEAHGPVTSPFWSDREKAEVTAGCYQLYLVLADVTAHPPPAVDAQTRPQRLREAIALIDRAAKLFPPTQAYRLRRARYLAQLGDEAAARQERERAAKMTPTSFIDHLLLGAEHYQQGEIHDAAQHYQKALLLEPNDFWSRCFLAVCQLKLRRPAEAAASLTVCLGQRPDFAWARLLRGLAHGELNDAPAAESDFHAALQLAASAEARYVVHVARGLQRFRQKRLDDAIADLQEAVTLRPKLFHARVTLAKLYQAQNRLDKSNEQLEGALALQPPPSIAAECHAQRSRNYYLRQQYQDALAASEAALRIAPEYAEGHQRRAVALVELRQFDEALASFGRYVASGGKAGAEFYRARGRARMQLGDFLGAKDDYTRALDLGPDAEIWAHRGWAYSFAEAWKPALRDFDEAIRLDPNHGHAYTGRGLARIMLGLCRDAVADADEARRHKPQSPEMMHNLACIYALAVAHAEKNAIDSKLQNAMPLWRQRALEAMSQTLAMVPAERRASFWRDKVRPDHALDCLRADAGFKALDDLYPKDDGLR